MKDSSCIALQQVPCRWSSDGKAVSTIVYDWNSKTDAITLTHFPGLLQLLLSNSQLRS